MRYWINFARTGNPNGAGLTRWPAYTAEREQVMLFARADAERRSAQQAPARFLQGALTARSRASTMTSRQP